MKAFVKTSKDNESFEFMEVTRPEANEDEILVKIMAIGVGIHDEYFHSADVDYPYVIGIEGAGIIEAVGQEVKDYKKGDRIAFISAMQPKGGTWAQYAVIDKDSLILHIPNQMTFEQASAFPVAGNTVLKALAGAALIPGQNLFISGGAGALGTLLIQIAKERGFNVVASASKQNHDYMKSLGAKHTVDYHDEDWQSQASEFVPGGFDAVIAIHPGTPIECQPILKDGGVLVAVSGDSFTPEREIILKGVFNDLDVKKELELLLNQIIAGKINQTVEKVYPFTEAFDALSQVQTRHTRGKIVLTLQ